MITVILDEGNLVATQITCEIGAQATDLTITKEDGSTTRRILRDGDTFQVEDY